MQFTNEDVGKLFTDNGGATVVRLLRIENRPVAVMRNLESGLEFESHEENIYQRLVPEVPKRKYERKATVKENLTVPPGASTGGGVTHEIEENKNPTYGGIALLTSDTEVSDILKLVAESGIPEDDIKKYIAKEFKYRGKTLESALQHISPAQREEVKLEIRRRCD